MNYRTKAERTWYKSTAKTYYITLTPGKYAQHAVPLIPLGLLIKPTLTTKTSAMRTLVRSGSICVNGKVSKNLNHPISPLDIVSIDNIHYRVELSSKFKLSVVENPIAYMPIKKITYLKNNVQQINCKNGYNYINVDVVKPASDSIICYNIVTKTMSIRPRTSLPHVIVARGKHIAKMYQNVVHTPEGIKVADTDICINKQYCLYYE